MGFKNDKLIIWECFCNEMDIQTWSRMRFHHSKSKKQSTEPITLDTIVCTKFWRAFNKDINFWTGAISCIFWYVCVWFHYTLLLSPFCFLKYYIRIIIPVKLTICSCLFCAFPKLPKMLSSVVNINTAKELGSHPLLFVW